MYDASIRQRKDGRLEMQIYVGVDDTGKSIRKSFYGKSEREVKLKRDKWIQEANLYEELRIGKTDEFSAWADTWLEIYKKPAVRAYTYEVTYKTKVEKYLKPYFKNRPLNTITQLDIQRFFNEYSNKICLATLETLRVTLSNIFKKAVINGLCERNPVEDIRLHSSCHSKERQAYNAKQQRIAIDWAIANERYELLTAMKTGLRRGELLGLRWCDVDLDNKVIYVNQSISPKLKNSDDIDKTLKSKSSKRVIPIDNELVDALKKMPRDGEYLFGNSTVNAFAKKANNNLKRMAKECGLPYLSLHELRHTFGTVLREKGVDIYTISKLLGHSSIGVTSSIYIHNDVEVLRQSMNI